MSGFALHPEAYGDVDDIRAYIAADNPDAVLTPVNDTGTQTTSAGTSKPSTHGHFEIGQLVAHRLELSSNHSRLNKGPRLAFSDQHTGLPR